jgi:hypothetical protein
MPPEAKGFRIRYNWMKFMYAYIIVGAGGLGLGLLVAPNTVLSMLGFPSQEPIWAGVGYSLMLAFGILSIFGLRAPLKFSPILLMSLTYKVIWFIAIFIPLLLAGELPSYAIPTGIIFATYIVGDLIAIPFGYLLAGE